MWASPSTPRPTSSVMAGSSGLRSVCEGLRATAVTRADIDAILAGSLGPQPSERAGGDEAVNQAVEHVLERGAPRTTAPDRALDHGHAVAAKRGDAGEAEHRKVGRARAEGAARHVGGEDADQDAIEEPLHQVLAHSRGTRGPDDHRRHRSPGELL